MLRKKTVGAQYADAFSTKNCTWRVSFSDERKEDKALRLAIEFASFLEIERVCVCVNVSLPLYSQTVRQILASELDSLSLLYTLVHKLSNVFFIFIF